jgi:hypothetical protein
MQTEEYFRSISTELDSLKNRVRHLIHDQHWQTDGEWKESVLRTIIQRSAPQNMTVGRGFIVDRDRSSTQIDILIYDNSYPVLYKDGDLVFISPSACRAVIEVKTSVTRTAFLRAVEKLGDVAELARGTGVSRRQVFTGLFVYEEIRWKGILAQLADSAGGRHRRIVDHVSAGPTQFVKFWTRDPATGRPPYQQWHEYGLYQMAQGYFAHNLITHLAPSDEVRRESVWFPEQGKEVLLVDQLEFDGRLPALAPQFLVHRPR